MSPSGPVMTTVRQRGRDLLRENPDLIKKNPVKKGEASSHEDNNPESGTDLTLSLCFRKKKRKSRWTDETCKTFIPGLPTMIPTGMSKEQEEAYLCKSCLFIFLFSFVFGLKSLSHEFQAELYF